MEGVARADELDHEGQLALRHVQARVEDSHLHHDPVSEVVRVSWRRAAAAGLRPDQIHAPYDANVDDDSRLHWAAAPAMTAVSADLPDLRSALLLTDRRVHVIQRWTRTAHTALQMDAVGAAPGFFCDEAVIGTNSIGMAASTRGDVLVRGVEHYADAFTHITCASRAVVDPFTGQVLGVVNMTIADPAPWQLMTALVGRVVHETHQRLLDEAGSKSVALYNTVPAGPASRQGPSRRRRRELALRRTPRAAGSWPHPTARRCGRGRNAASVEAPVRTRRCSCPSGPPPRSVRRSTTAPSSSGPSSASPRSRPAHSTAATPGWARLTDAEQSVAELVAAGYTNREAATTLFLSPHTVDYHLRHIFRKLDIDSRIQLARIVEQT